VVEDDPIVVVVVIGEIGCDSFFLSFASSKVTFNTTRE
jgi:hypothetical protein